MEVGFRIFESRGKVMFKSVGNSLSVVCLSAVFLFTISAWAQISPYNHAYALASTINSTSDSPSVREAPPLTPGTHGTSDTNGTVVIELETRKNTVPTSAAKTIPPTLTVTTAALLELHAMRQSAVNLCLELPGKYRTRLPECADIFKHEIRLKALAKERRQN